jgi:hypothetical protein
MKAKSAFCACGTCESGYIKDSKFTMSSLPAATKEELRVACIAERPGLLARQQQADAAASDWNAVHVDVGSFADEHSTL